MDLRRPHSSICLRFAMLPLKFQTDKRTIYQEVNNLSEAHISQTGQQQSQENKLNLIQHTIQEYLT
jgi:hypothetical protein